jgi:hypothetical protein
MTKIVYNACFGGFCLSDAAITRYADLTGLAVETDEWGLNTPDGWTIYDVPRTDPYLIQVIEELGPGAAGLHCTLTIVDLPPGTRYYIHKYDGFETIITEDQHNWSVA